MISDQTQADHMVVEIARLLKNSKNTFHGLASPIPAVAIALTRETHNPDLQYLNIAGGVNVSGHVPSISTCGSAFWEGSESFFSLTDIFDLCARGELDTAFLSGVQIDRHGNLNNSVIGEFLHPKVKLPGGAGSAAIVPHASTTIVWRTRHTPKVFVESCDFVTASGNVRYVVTPIAVFERIQGTLVLIKTMPYSKVEDIRSATGFDFKKHENVQVVQPPTAEEEEILQRVDPKGIRLSEF